MEIKSTGFGVTKAGEEVTKYTLYNDHGASVSILNYGGIITDIMVPDKNGHVESVVLGMDSIEAYEEKSPYFGCIVGRIAGRISGASFDMDGTTYALAANNNGHALHGGLQGFDKVIWQCTEIMDGDAVSLSLNYLSKDGEEGFPGNLDVQVTYRFTNDNALEIFYKGTTDKKTIVNMTNHSYFNLAGNGKRDILGQVLMLDADKYGLVDSDIIPAGIADVAGTAFDFRTPKKVGQDLTNDEEQLTYAGGGYDHPFMLKDHDGVKASLYDAESGRYMDMFTDQKSVVVYACNQMEEGIPLSHGAITKPHLAVCLETQYYPDAINQSCFESQFLEPGETYEAYTMYRFSIK
ncbi:galactose mutarotase [Vallitalea pronyensis]|uniref:Aldose 1-epimerase n=1 Tax=Vallitalea pronyensis TaxID=1348613 RepID=A0A8J8MHG4_9FIRM|nr:aldose epimerase family protein [Vallitalea pronyensis]QUI21705.1 galactose mutarotase [Vallitalea pronyensis]